MKSSALVKNLGAEGIMVLQMLPFETRDHPRGQNELLGTPLTAESKKYRWAPENTEIRVA